MPDQLAAPRLCVTIGADSTAELRRRRDLARHADLVELRLDTVRDPDVAGALAGRRTPVIVTCRPAWEGGRFGGSEEERHRLLGDAVRLGAEYVDIECRAGFDDLVRARDGRGIVLSLHDFEGVPADLADRVRAMRHAGAEVVKVAITATRLSDVLRLLPLAGTGPHGSLVSVAMGTPGLVTRVLPARFGSCWSYAGDGFAPGHVSPDRMLAEFRFRESTSSTGLYGIVGRPIGHSLSPAMHNAAFARAGRDAVYLPLEAADADDFLAFAAALDVRGASVTAPFKQELFARADDLDDCARRIGAVNTLRRSNGRWAGANFDPEGFLAPLAGRDDLRGARVAILGSGGAARAVAVALASVAGRITVYGRTLARATEVARLVGGTAALPPPPPGSWDVLVNATPVGTAPDEGRSPVAGAALMFKDGRLVYDLVYNPARTRLLADAAAAGCETIGGLEMLVAQARLQFAWWTGQDLPAAVFRRAAEDHLAAYHPGQPS